MAADALTRLNPRKTQCPQWSSNSIIPFMHKGYIHISSQITLFLRGEKPLAWSAVYVFVPMQPYIVEICDSLRGKIFQKFIERWDWGVGDWEDWVEQFANILLNPHFPPRPIPPQWQIYSFLPMEECGAQHPCEYMFLLSTGRCVFPLRVLRKHCSGAFDDVKHKTGVLKKSIILGAAADTRASHLWVFVSYLCFYPLASYPSRLSASRSTQKY